MLGASSGLLRVVMLRLLVAAVRPHRLLYLGLLVGSAAFQASTPKVPSTPVLSAMEPIDAAFNVWHDRQRSQEHMRREVNRLAHPDVPLWLVFEGIAQPTVVSGCETTDMLQREATRLFNLQPDQRLQFFCGSTVLPLGAAISSTPLANTRNVQVRVKASGWPIKRVRFSEFAAGTTAIAATRAGRDAAAHLARPPVVRRQQCPHVWID